MVVKRCWYKVVSGHVSSFSMDVQEGIPSWFVVSRFGEQCEEELCKQSRQQTIC